MNEETRIELMIAGLRTVYKGADNTRPDRNLLVIWSRAVMERDRYTCRECGATRATGRRMHAHHIKPWDDFPELRFFVDNGKTLCHVCHAAEHKRLRAARRTVTAEKGHR